MAPESPITRGRIPHELWAQAVALTATLPVTRVAHQLGLTSSALKRRRERLQETPAPMSLPQAPQFVEVAPVWPSPTTEVEIQRPDGTRLRITYRATTPVLVPLLQTFLEAR